MNDGGVANRASFTDAERRSRVRMQDRPVLNICPLPDRYDLVIAAQYRVEPNSLVLADPDIYFR